MKYLIACDSYKDCLSSFEVGTTIEKGVLKGNPKAIIETVSISDGGEGFLSSFIDNKKGIEKTIKTKGPLSSTIDSSYLVIPEKKTAIIEIAKTCGLELVPIRERNPYKTTSYGVGEIIRDAILSGNKKIIVGLGGSSTNDAGLGMLCALGFKFYDKKGNELSYEVKNLGKIYRIDKGGVIFDFSDIEIIIASDVNAKLFGKRGATEVFGRQKGATEPQVQELEKEIRVFSSRCASFIGRDFSDEEGAGAAGGLGFALMAFLNGQVKSGINVIIDLFDVENKIKHADIIITGEGKLDGQTAFGKAPFGIAKLAKKYNKKVICLAGTLGEGAEECLNYGVTAYFCILNRVCTLEEAVNRENAIRNIETTAEQISRVLNINNKVN